MHIQNHWEIFTVCTVRFRYRLLEVSEGKSPNQHFFSIIYSLFLQMEIADMNQSELLERSSSAKKATGRKRKEMNNPAAIDLE